MIEDEAEAEHWLLELPGYDAAIHDRLHTFVRLLGEENTRQNLVARSSLGQVWRRHIADSAQLLAHVPQQVDTWLDLGTGAGFPGLIVATLLPSTEVTLVESRGRRATWLQSAAQHLRLGNVRVHGGDVRALPTRAYGAISARAFAPLERLVALAARFSTSDTIWLLPKGRSAGEELEALCGWQQLFHVEQSITDAEAGIIVGRLIGPEEQRG